MVKYSVFTPVYNEQGNILPLFKQIKEVMESISKDWELIFVNDGSSDKSLVEMKSIDDKRVKIVDLRRNYGQAIAMDAGFREASGEFVISLDADLQNDPKDIPRLLKKLEQDNLDVVAGWRFKRKDPLWMIFVTTIAKFLRSFFASDGVHDSGCTLRVYRREIIEDMEFSGEMHRYIMALLRWKGARVGELKVNHRARVHGVSKYGLYKSVKGFVDLFYIWFMKKFSGRPLHLFGVTGLFLMFSGGVFLAWSIYLKVFLSTSLSDSAWFTLAFFLILVGLQFFISGIMLDVMMKNYYNTSKERRYHVRKVYSKN